MKDSGESEVYLTLYLIVSFTASFEVDVNIYTPEQAAKLLQVHTQTLRRWLRTGEISGADTPAGWRLTDADIAAWLAKYRSRGELDATTYLLSSPANAARLTEAFNDWRAGRNIQERELLPDDD